MSLFIDNNNDLTSFPCLRTRIVYVTEHKTFYMKLLYIKRNTKTEKRYNIKMGKLTTEVTYIKRYFMGIPIKTLQKYRETYYGKIKDCDDCVLFV
jgi:hypothetical protein